MAYLGFLIGATVVSEDATELVQILALAVWQKIRIDVLADFPDITQLDSDNSPVYR